ncbi:ferredoxin [Actinoplanes ianthinogenes]|uniref:Ferredoxin n=1 Tax=Actinoplanes ianthinogenes TaxID=122358 RepID=A0ABN6CSY6_9ACTN|nr:PDR/VanB family oxidoreductase [Actinoplanes ianthinogenes]BCJ48245.1 ferredoxin [Actinoplanes ianthinogenes]GGR07395.1 ferredoxin [Actinoplanes ianthinogenes]
MKLLITRRFELAAGVVALDLRHPDGAELPGWAPGAHVDLHLREGLTRQYSLCGDPADRTTWRIAVRLRPRGRGGSRHVHDLLSANDQVEVSGPRNHFALRPAPRYLFIAGGIGITPILPMLAAAADAAWELHYAGRGAATMPFRQDLLRYGDQVTFYPDGGLDLDALAGAHAPDTLVYCCGPESLLLAAEARWPGPNLHVERFTPRDDRKVRTGFDIELTRTGRTLSVPDDRSILEVLEDNGVDVLSSCREGTCGTCETTVLAGRVDHRDSLLTPAERDAHDTMFVCVSRAAGDRLVLDL